MGKISEKTIAQITAQLKLSDVFSEYARLTRKGNDYWVKCPFHGGGTERTPSCKIDDDRDHYYCFGCKASGSMFDLVMNMEHLTFPESVKYLADKAGVTVEETQSTPGQKQHEDESKILFDLYSRLAGTFRWFLKEHISGEGAREYLNRRAVSPEMQEKFMLGYAPKDKDFLYRFLKKQGYTDEILRKSGLFSANSYPWPLFRDRLMFPIRDFRGRVIAFSGRDLSGSDKAPKYINSPETAIYSKKMNVFGLYESLDSLKQKGSRAIMLEGNFDVIAMHQAGYTTAMAPLGTAFTEDQCKRIARYTEDFDLMFDSDDAGQESTDKAINIISSQGHRVKIHRLESCKDAGETVEKLGVDGLKREFEPSLSAFDYLVEKNLKRYNIGTPGGKSAFLRAFSSYLQAQRSEVEKKTYILSLSDMLHVGEEAIMTDLSRMDSDGRRYERNAAPQEETRLRPLNTAAISDELLLMLHLAVDPERFRTARLKVRMGDLTDPMAQQVFVALEDSLTQGITRKELFLTLIQDEQLRAYVSTAFVLDEFTKADGNVVDELEKRIALKGVINRQASVQKQIEYVQHTNDPDAVFELLSLKKELDMEVNRLKSELYNSSK